jgi:beta-lysine N6-acetyltransferase
MRRLGVVSIVLDRGVRTTAIGQVYGLDFEIEGDGFSVRVYFDYYNRRLKVLSYRAEDYRSMCARLTWLANENGFDKILVKARDSDWQSFLPSGFVLEGILRYYYRGDDAYVLGRFGSQERLRIDDFLKKSQLIEELLGETDDHEILPLDSGLRVAVVGEELVPALVDHYEALFPNYYTPLTHPDYLLQTMHRNVIYRAVVDPAGRVVSAGSAELTGQGSAELGDCATRAAFRGRSLIYHVIDALEAEVRERQCVAAFGLATSVSASQNRMFRRMGYEYSGRLLKNFAVEGGFEDMNIWTKRLGSPAAGVNGGSSSTE